MKVKYFLCGLYQMTRSVAQDLGITDKYKYIRVTTCLLTFHLFQLVHSILEIADIFVLILFKMNHWVSI